jgi:hypothetical protein
MERADAYGGGGGGRAAQPRARPASTCEWAGWCEAEPTEEVAVPFSPEPLRVCAAHAVPARVYADRQRDVGPLPDDPGA